MPSVLYGEQNYGDFDYGRIAASLVAASGGQVRETGLKVSIVDERVNRWELFTGINPATSDIFRVAGSNATLQTYWSYRNQAAAIKDGNGDIYRVRVGDGTLGDYKIYEQTITDPTVEAQWHAWSVLYTGTHYAIALSLSGGVAQVWHSKSDGLYHNNSKIWDQDGIIRIACVANSPFAMYVTVVSEDPIDGAGVYRKMDLYYTDDATSVDPDYDYMNYRWYDNTIAAILNADGKLFRYQSLPRYDPRAYNNGDSIVVSWENAIDSHEASVAPRIIRGLAGEVGHNMIRNIFVFDFTDEDGYIYLFYSEAHRDDDFESTQSGGAACHWQRSKDGIHWSEPVSSGFSDIGVALISHSGFVWYPSFDVVYRRPSTPVVYTLDNFVPRASFEIPRDNQEGSAEVLVANPNGINNVIENLSDRVIHIETGLKVEDGTYEFTEFNSWWIKRVVKDVEAGVNRLTIQCGDVWTRLASQFRDTFNFVGQLNYDDWLPGKRNKAFNYYFATDTNPSQANGQLATRGIVLYTGWKGQNATVRAHFSTITGNEFGLIFRYIDARNYQRLQYSISDETLSIISKVNGVEFIISADSVVTGDSSPVIEIRFEWERYFVKFNGLVVSQFGDGDQPNVKPGYVGFFGTRYTITSFHLLDWEAPITHEELIKTALAMGDYHLPVVAHSTSQELAIIWGPQTDVPTPADGLRQALEASKWELVWQDGVLRVGAFSDPSIVKIIDDRIIKTDYVDEANRHINLAAVDGNEDSWMETDAVDTQQRDRQISAYFDLPELTDEDSTRARAVEEIRRGKLGRTPGGQIPLDFYLRRMDAVTWIDNAGESNDVRIEGISVEIEQGMQPSQRETLDTSLLDA